MPGVLWDRYSWIRGFIDDGSLDSFIHLTPSNRRRLIRIELALTLLTHVAPGRPVEAVPALLSSNPVPSRERAGWSREMKHMAAVAAVLLPRFTRTFYWRREWKWYQSRSEERPGVPFLYRIEDGKSPPIIAKANQLPDPGRRDNLIGVLKGPVHRKRRRRPPAPSGEYKFVSGATGGEEAVSISEEALAALAAVLEEERPGSAAGGGSLASNSPHQEKSTGNGLGSPSPESGDDESPRSHAAADPSFAWITAKTPRAPGEMKPWEITIDDLAGAARRLDEIDPGGKWEARLDRMVLQFFHDDGGVDSRTLTIDGFTHLIGMVGAGKTTLTDLIIYLAHETERRVTVVVNDVTAVMDKVVQLRNLNIRAVPILGATNRKKHIERIARVAGAPWLKNHPLGEALDFLDTGCMLAAGLSRPIPIDGAPCFNLRPAEGRGLYSCPFIPACPRFRTERSLAEAEVWVTTVEGLISRRLRNQEEQWLMAEVVYRNCDLVIIDEIDVMQQRADRLFAGTSILYAPGAGVLQELSSRSQALFSRATSYAGDERYYPLGKTIETAQGTIMTLFNWLLVNRSESRAFTSWSLLRQLSYLLSGWSSDYEEAPENGGAVAKQLFDKLLDICQLFLEDPRGFKLVLSETRDSINEDTLRAGFQSLVELGRTVTEQTEIDRREAAGEWLGAIRRILPGLPLEPADKEQAEQWRRKIIDTVILAVVTTRLEDAIKKLMLWGARIEPEDTDLEGLYRAAEMILPRPVAGYEGIVPEPAPGVLLEFQYTTRDSDQEASLSYTRITGNGRAFLQWFPHIYEPLTDIGGPHVLALSGSSWAPDSAQHHVKPEVAGTIGTPGSAPAIHAHVVRPYGGEPIRVSGSRDRDGNLREITRELVSRGDSQISTLERKRDYLSRKPEFRDRARMALLVNSYHQSGVVFDAIKSYRPDLINSVRIMVRDDDAPDAFGGRAMQRNRIEQFAFDDDSWLLIANIPAFGRAHNIINDDGTSALAAAYFLVRPMPVPDDPQRLLAKLNQWALDYLGRELADKHVDEAFTHFRRRAWTRFRDTIARPATVAHRGREELLELYWDQVVTHMQTIGRFIRRGDAHVYFCDAAYWPWPGSPGIDGNRGSVLLGMKHVLGQYIGSPAGNDPPPVRQEALIAEALYKPFYDSLVNLGDLGV